MFLKQDSLLTRVLPANVHILTAEAWNASDTLLLRLEHQFEMGEDVDLSKNATVSLVVCIDTPWDLAT